MERRDFFKIGLVGGASFALLRHSNGFTMSSTKKDTKQFSEYVSTTGTFSHKELLDLARKHGSPLYVYDGDLIVNQYKKYEQAFKSQYPNVKVHYAFKANTNLNILQLLLKQGAGGECISVGEMKMGMKVGYDPAELIFTSNSKELEELEFAVVQGVVINLDSLHDLENLIKVVDKLKKSVRVSFRINPDVNPKTHKHISTGHKFTKFGILQEEGELITAYQLAKENPYIKAVGVHSHIGSQILEVKPFLKNVEIVTGVALKVKEKLGIELEFLNLGGGLGIPYQDGQAGLSPEELARTVCPVIKKNLSEFKKLPELWLEPGRYFVAQSGVLVTKVNSIKMTHYKNFINVNTGFNHLVRPLLYEAHHRVRLLGENVHTLNDLYDFEVAGNICETGDILAQYRRLPVPKVGDYMAFLDAGAYGFSMASEYNSFLLPAELIKRNGKYYTIRKRETFEDLLRNQELIKELS